MWGEDMKGPTRAYWTEQHSAVHREQVTRRSNRPVRHDLYQNLERERAAVLVPDPGAASSHGDHTGRAAGLPGPLVARGRRDVGDGVGQITAATNCCRRRCCSAQEITGSTLKEQLRMNRSKTKDLSGYLEHEGRSGVADLKAEGLPTFPGSVYASLNRLTSSALSRAGAISRDGVDSSSMGKLARHSLRRQSWPKGDQGPDVRLGGLARKRCSPAWMAGLRSEGECETLRAALCQ